MRTGLFGELARDRRRNIAECLPRTKVVYSAQIEELKTIKMLAITLGKTTVVRFISLALEGKLPLGIFDSVCPLDQAYLTDSERFELVAAAQDEYGLERVLFTNEYATVIGELRGEYWKLREMFWDDAKSTYSHEHLVKSWHERCSLLRLAEHRKALRHHEPDPLSLTRNQRLRLMAASRLSVGLQEAGIYTRSHPDSLFNLDFRWQFVTDNVLSYVEIMAAPLVNLQLTKFAFDPFAYMLSHYRYKIPTSVAFSYYPDTRFVPLHCGRIVRPTCPGEFSILAYGIAAGADERIRNFAVTLACQKGDWIARKRNVIGHPVDMKP